MDGGAKRNLGVILGAGLVLRFALLGTRQLTTDELTQALVVREPTLRGMMERLRTGMAVPAPLDYLLQKLMVLLLGESTWVMRLHAALLGVLSIWLLFRIARLLFGERAALYSAVLFALYPLHHHHSQEGRPYALLVFLTLLSYDLLLGALVAKTKALRLWVLLGVVLALLLYGSFLGLLVIGSQLAGLMAAAMLGAGATEAMPRPTLRQIGGYCAAAAAACALFVPWIVFAWMKPHMSPASEVADPRMLLRLVKEIGDNSYPISLLLLAGATVGVRALRRHGRSRTLALLLSWLLLSLPAVLLLEIWAGYFFAIRHILHSTPPLLMLAGYGMAHLSERFRIVSAAPAPIGSPAFGYAALLLAMLGWTAWVHGRAEPSDWRGAAAYLQARASREDAVAVPEVYPLIEYYAPDLARFRAQPWNSAAELAATSGNRRFVLCCDKLFPDPCRGFREEARADPAWRRVEFRGFTLFQR